MHTSLNDAAEHDRNYDAAPNVHTTVVEVMTRLPEDSDYEDDSQIFSEIGSYVNVIF